MSKTWKKCLETLKGTVPVGQFSVWIKPLKAQEKNGTLTILAPNDSAVSYLKKNLKQKIKDVIAQHDKSLKILIGVVGQPQAKKQHTTPLLDDYTFENLVLGNANQIAYGAIQQIAENLKNSPYNPCIVYGGSGLGKTHLMQAAGHLVKEKDPKAKIIYMPLMDFVRNITTSLRHNTIENIKSYYQSADLLLVDDIHLIAGKEKSQEEFFHIFNFLFSTKKQIIFTCDQPPKNIKSLEERLKTRFSQGLNLLLKPPELEMRAAILLKKAHNEKINIELTEDMALYIAGNIDSNVRDLEGALLKLKAFIDFSKLPNLIITKEVIDTALGDLIKPQAVDVDINDIQKEVARHYGITISDLSSKSRKQHTVLARQMAIFIAHELTNLSLANIGKHFGNRDHSTVLHAIKKIKLKVEEAETKSNYAVIKLKLANL
ncbi:chromosomal replication initiator protein DnaA [bacterium endosymbiont of Bathymodiolus sp. 5 South]|jgi:chromosomal replication initiator protein|uniref:chromosomal replication initiator protein DnaA n=1 Tax=bacterium endosymbiont of Bathymodiolus sp. 5 South TaxID=1181670 RepID=UPI0010AFFBF8|nr:chromosomal replication initiator protein DnaA [bacterium endosymbiont of Bathymodiolus sp. 5 South]CAC9646426.1 Chromosomal replication initiator protein DnaA [uncultured Gammaproteobacteria bacterium]SHN90710.1 Chromosomal replication initiator protein DnaA [bacterium endosymbiont of Bathymodiolus sp. 5 South]SSC06951.1 Chromosomal replication initiator protein DnaA [bacterium endosymbiont of Bathymodiolus sp. 5 South]VVH55873.1 Chromosomal replication initiator protein DnaA [uncultured Ga